MDNVKAFFHTACFLADGKFPNNDIYRVTSVQVSFGQSKDSVFNQNIALSMLAAADRDGFLILNSEKSSCSSAM